MFLNFLEIVTIGLPFCVFKIITGYFYGQTWLIAFGVIDLVINAINLLSILFFRRRVLSACLLSLVVKLVKKPTGDVKGKWEDFGNSIDVLVSFVLVAIMIASNNLILLSATYLISWNVAVVLNVLGAGLGRLTDSIKKLPT